jgi:hypothetical protein
MKFWHSNRLDQEADYDPKDVATRFIAAVRNGFDLSTSRPSMDFAFRWWLTDPKEFNATWDEGDYDELWNALEEVMTDEDEQFIRDRLMARFREADEARVTE